MRGPQGVNLRGGCSQSVGVGLRGSLCHQDLSEAALPWGLQMKQMIGRLFHAEEA